MATVPIDLACSREAGFVMDPNEHERIGYVTALDGFGLAEALKADLQVCIPGSFEPSFKGLKATAPSSEAPVRLARVVAVIENFRWPGGVGDPITLDFYVSQANAHELKALQQQALKTTKIKSLAWWIADYDQESQEWYEAAYPLGVGKLTGIVSGKENPELDVDLNPVVAKDGIDVNVYKVMLKVAPAGNLQYTLHFANSAQKRVVKSWGLVVGDFASAPPV